MISWHRLLYLLSSHTWSVISLIIRIWRISPLMILISQVGRVALLGTRSILIVGVSILRGIICVGPFVVQAFSDVDWYVLDVAASVSWFFWSERCDAVWVAHWVMYSAREGTCLLVPSHWRFWCLVNDKRRFIEFINGGGSLNIGRVWNRSMGLRKRTVTAGSSELLAISFRESLII